MTSYSSQFTAWHWAKSFDLQAHSRDALNNSSSAASRCHSVLFIYIQSDVLKKNDMMKIGSSGLYLAVFYFEEMNSQEPSEG